MKNFAGIDKGFYSVGIDGCRDGWITAVIHKGELSLHKSVCFRETMDQRPFDACLVDMVIGLRVMEAAKQMRCKPDDITDAVCLAIAANMLAQGRAETIPPEPMMDDTGLLMQMVIPKVVKMG